MSGWMINDFNYQAVLFNDDRLNVNVLNTNELLDLARIAEKIEFHDSSDSLNCRFNSIIKRSKMRTFSSQYNQNININRKAIFIKYVADCCFVLCLKWGEEMNSASTLNTNASLITELCLYTFKLYAKSSMDPFFMLKKLTLIGCLLAEIKHIDEFSAKLFIYFFNESVSTLEKLKRLCWTEVNSDSIAEPRVKNTQKHLCHYVVSTNQTHLVLLLHLTCFFENSPDKMRRLKRFTASNLDLLQSTFFTVEKNYLDLLDPSMVRAVKSSIDAIELVKLIHDYFDMFSSSRAGATEADFRIRSLLEQVLSAKFGIFQHNSYKNEYQCLLLTLLAQYFYEQFKDVETKVDMNKDFLRLLIHVNKLLFESYLMLFSLNQPNLSQNLPISLWPFSISIEFFQKLYSIIEETLANELNRVKDNSEQTYILGCMEEFFNFNFDAFKTIQTAKLCKLEILESAFIESELSIIECCSMLHQAIEKGWNVNQNESCQDKLIQLCMKRITELGLFVESEGDNWDRFVTLHLTRLMAKEEFEEAFECFKTIYKVLEKCQCESNEWAMKIWCYLKDKAASSDSFSETYRAKWEEMTLISFVSPDNNNPA